MQSLGAVTERFPLRKEVRGGKRGISLVFQNGVLFPLPSAHAGLFFARNKFFFVNARADLRGRFDAAQINHGFDFCFSCRPKSPGLSGSFPSPAPGLKSQKCVLPARCEAYRKIASLFRPFDSPSLYEIIPGQSALPGYVLVAPGGIAPLRALRFAFSPGRENMRFIACFRFLPFDSHSFYKIIPGQSALPGCVLVAPGGIAPLRFLAGAGKHAFHRMFSFPPVRFPFLYNIIPGQSALPGYVLVAPRGIEPLFPP